MRQPTKFSVYITEKHPAFSFGTVRAFTMLTVETLLLIEFINLLVCDTSSHYNSISPGISILPRLLHKYISLAVDFVIVWCIHILVFLKSLFRFHYSLVLPINIEYINSLTFSNGYKKKN